MNNWQHSGPPSKLRSFYRAHASHVLTSRGLRQQNLLFDLPGCGQRELRNAGFAPVFLDRKSGDVFPSTHDDGRAAKTHILDGLPDEFVVRRARNGKVTAVSGSMVAGYTRNERFYSREAAVESVRQLEGCLDSHLATT